MLSQQLSCNSQDELLLLANDVQKWFSGRVEHEFSNQTHDYFISVIENVADILEHGLNKAFNADPQEMPDRANISQLNNMFEHLELEDLTEFADTPAQPSSTPPASYEITTEESDPNNKTFPEDGPILWQRQSRPTLPLI